MIVFPKERARMHRLLLACLGGITLFLPMLSQADPTTAVETLPDEAAECRRLLTLCEAVRTRGQAIQEREAKAERKSHQQYKKAHQAEKVLTRWEKASRNSHAAPDKAVLRAEKYQQVTEEESYAAHQQVHAESVHDEKAQEYEDRLRTANKVAAKIRAKHATMPACFERCGDVLNLEELR
jgi:hypothetical protein